MRRERNARQKFGELVAARRVIHGIAVDDHERRDLLRTHRGAEVLELARRRRRQRRDFGHVRERAALRVERGVDPMADLVRRPGEKGTRYDYARAELRPQIARERGQPGALALVAVERARARDAELGRKTE